MVLLDHHELTDVIGSHSLIRHHSRRESGGTPTQSCQDGEIYDHYWRRCVSDSPSGQNCPSGYAYNVLNKKCEGL